MDESVAYLGACAGTAEASGHLGPYQSFLAAAVCTLACSPVFDFGWTSSAGISGLLHVLIFWLLHDIPH